MDIYIGTEHQSIGFNELMFNLSVGKKYDHCKIVINDLSDYFKLIRLCIQLMNICKFEVVFSYVHIKNEEEYELIYGDLIKLGVSGITEECPVNPVLSHKYFDVVKIPDYTTFDSPDTLFVVFSEIGFFKYLQVLQLGGNLVGELRYYNDIMDFVGVDLKQYGKVCVLYNDHIKVRERVNGVLDLKGYVFSEITSV